MIDSKISHDSNVEARIEDLIVELENIPYETIEISHVARKLRVILCRASDARHELLCRQADFDVTV